MRHRKILSRRERLLVSLCGMLVLGAIFAAVVLAAPTLSTDPASPDGSNGWFHTLPTVTIGPALPGSYTLYKWLPAGPMTIYAGPFKLGANAYGQPTMRYGYGVAPTAFDDSATLTFKIDPVAPLVTGLTNITGLPATSWTSSSDATFTVQYTEVHSGIQGYSYEMSQSQPSVDAVVDSAISPLGFHSLYTGRWYLQIRAVDNAGNWGPVYVREHLVDKTPPVTSDDVVPYYEGTATVNASAVDGHSGVQSIETRIDGGTYSTLSQRAITATGTHELAYRASDVAGNMSAETTVGFTVVPNEAPVTSINGVDSAWHTFVKFTLSATDNLSGVDRTYFQIDSGPVTDYTGEVTISNPGIHSVRFWSVDVAGNVETAHIATVKTDNQGPLLNQDFATPVEGTATITYSASDPLSGLSGPVAASIDGVPWLLGSPIVLTAPGVHSIIMDAYDALGNRTVWSGTAEVFANQPPVTYISGLTGAYATSAGFELFADDNCSGVAMIHYRLDGGPVEDYYGPVEISKEGTTAIEYWSEDSAGNVEPTRGPEYAMVDRSAPVTTVRTWSPRVGSTSFALSALDSYTPVAKVSYRLDGGAVTTYTAPVTTSVKGLHTLVFWSADDLGNVEVAHTKVFAVAKMPTTLSTRVSSTAVLSGRAVVVSGVLKSADGIIRRSSGVSLWVSVMGGTWRKVGAVAYDPATGAYRIARTVTANQRLQLRFAGDAVNLGCASAILPVGCKVYISAPVTPWFNSVGRYVVVYGTLSPRHAIGTKAATLYCYRFEDDVWVLHKTASAYAYYALTGTKYGAFLSLPSRGRWRIVAVHSDAAHLRTASPARTLLVQ